jgi:poly(hydroxyalkanoate) depolymerase family esterase
LAEATAALQRMLAGNATPASSALRSGRTPPTIDGFAEPVRAAAAARSTLPRFDFAGLQLPGKPAVAAQPVPKGAEFLSRTFTNGAGSRPYKLYVPSSYHGQAVPLIVMLHGCTQSPDDFAAGTGMNAAAEAHNCLVAYPGQTSAANMQKCWNWFSAADQQRDAGEPSLIAGITRAVMADYTVDPAQVFVAGLSAGGAAAAIMGEAYPELYAAVGVHSGLACGAAHDVPSAFAAMQGRTAAPATRSGRPVRIIVFHGDRDSTVNSRNGDAVIAQAAHAAALTATTEHGQVTGGHAYTRTRHRDAANRIVSEQWVVHGGGHAWFGGSPVGSYTDPKGPDATGEMMRFFLGE